jgi:hypothetical protein
MLSRPPATEDEAATCDQTSTVSMALFGARAGDHGMRNSCQRLSRLLEALLGQLAVRAGNDKLIYQDILCMSWATVLDRDDLLGRGGSSKPTYAEPAPSEFAVVLKGELDATAAATQSLHVPVSVVP